MSSHDAYEISKMTVKAK